MPYKDPERQKEYQRNHYKANKKKYRKSMLENRKTRHAYVQEIKESSPCLDCENFFPYYVMQFDHRDAGEKSYAVSWMLNRFSLAEIKAEIDKCDIVCANCHATRTFKRKMGIPL